MAKQQMSKRSRKARKQAKEAKLPKNLGHPSHVSLTKRRFKKKSELMKVFSSDDTQQATGA
jgi:hypothetical protein